MGIDWEEILGAEGEDILDAYEKNVGNNNYVVNYDYDYIERLSDVESDQISNLYDILTLIDEWRGKHENIGTMDLLNSEKNEKIKILNEIIEKSYEYEYVYNYYNGEATLENIYEGLVLNFVHIYRMQDSERLFDFWKMLRRGIDNYNLKNYNSLIDKENEIFDNIYIDSVKSIKKFIDKRNDFFDNNFKDMSNECHRYCDYLEYIDEYMPTEIIEKYIVGCFVLNVANEFTKKEDSQRTLFEMDNNYECENKLINDDAWDIVVDDYLNSINNNSQVKDMKEDLVKTEDVSSSKKNINKPARKRRPKDNNRSNKVIYYDDDESF